MSDQHGGSEQNLRQKSTTESILLYTKKEINIASNLHYFVEKYFSAITERSLCGINAYRFWINSINRDHQILQAAVSNSAGVLITSVSIASANYKANIFCYILVQRPGWPGGADFFC